VQCHRPTPKLGMRLVGEPRQIEVQKITTAVTERGPFEHVTALWRASGYKQPSKNKIAEDHGLYVLSAVAAAPAYQE
jgi:hypothetical protein